jgi:hypothetical protein
VQENLEQSIPLGIATPELDPGAAKPLNDEPKAA